MPSIKRTLAGLFLTVLLAAQAGAQNLPEMNADNVEAWADALFSEAQKTKRYSGAVVAFVKDGELGFSKGYGYADYLRGTPIDPARTAFQIGSITKTFTATAIAKLIDQGLIKSLDDAANTYLKRMQLPAPGGEQITLKQLITHSAGFENRVYNIATDKSPALPLSAQAIQSFAAEVVNQPGRYVSYNNYSSTVLGVVVEDITGTTIAKYFEQEIFTPLGMDHSILNMSPEATEGLGVAYAFLPSGEPLPFPHRSIQQFFAPVGGANSTAEDIARFMLANLEAGKGTAQPIMSPAAFDLMHTRHAGNHALSSGFGMIYFIWDWNGHKLVLHGGDWPGTHSGMLMIPGLNSGIFFSLMADYPEIPLLEGILGSERTAPVDGVEIGTPISNIGVIVNFLEHFLGPAQAPVVTGFTSTDPQEFVGNYVGQSTSHTGMDIMLSFLSPFTTVRVRAADEGGLLINDKGPYKELVADVFWSSNVKTQLAGFFLDSPLYVFSRDEHGEIDYLSPQIGFDAWVKKGVFGVPSNYLMAWALLFVFLMSGFLCLFYPRVKRNSTVKWLPPVIAVLLVSMPLLLLLGYAEGDSMMNHLLFGRSVRFASFAVLANLIAVLAVFCAWTLVKVWRESYWSERRFGAALRVHYSLLCIAALLLIPVFNYSNLLGL